MTKDEALKLALKFVEDSECGTADLEAHIKEALAQPEQEPVACKECHLKDLVYDLLGDLKVANLKLSVRAKRTWVGLTDEEITELHHEIKVRLMGTYKTDDIYRAIEAKLKEKNT
jgi:hypothetical protein